MIAAPVTRRRHPPPKLPQPKEATVLRAVLDFVRYHPRVAKAWRQNSGAFRVEQRFIRTADEPGIPDICGYMKGGRALYIEVKAPRGKLSYWQKRFLDEAKVAGAVCGVARSIEDAKAILEAA